MFQFTHPGRGATGQVVIIIAESYVSIHAPREGCDLGATDPLGIIFGFNSRTPGGVRLRMFDRGLPVDTFQFTHPGRGATHLEELVLLFADVSIHAPREGCDVLGVAVERVCVVFQFTHPGRGATLMSSRRLFHPRFNSRTPGGVRQRVSATVSYQSGFNSRTPGGVRQLDR